MSRATESVEEHVRRVTGATHVAPPERVVSLWSGYGEIVRVALGGAEASSVIVKRVAPPTSVEHPRGIATDRSHARKLRSYDVEMRFYEEFAHRCGAACRVPRALGCRADRGQWSFVLEDLDEAGFHLRREHPSKDEVRACLSWLAAFHATFLDASAEGLWTTGTYWHLETRPDELAKMGDAKLRDAAVALDAALGGCQHKTLVHGDAKVANFCFTQRTESEGVSVAAVDFQYVGGGCGMKDVAYFFSSVWNSTRCESEGPAALDFYFDRLAEVLQLRGATVNFAALESEWRGLYPFAWADFYRFLDGWAPGHFKMHAYSRRLTDQALALLGR